MLAKLGKRWWLALVCPFPVAFLGLLSAAFVNYNAQPMYVARTTVMESAMISRGDAPKPESSDPDTRMRHLATIAMSQATFSNAAQTLSNMGINPKQVLSSVTVTPVKDTNILAVEVTMPDAHEAKTSADVIAAEFKKEYQRLYPPKSSEYGEMALKTIDPGFVFPVNQHHALKLGIGLVGGFFGGIVLGLILAALLPIRPQPERLAQEGG